MTKALFTLLIAIVTISLNALVDGFTMMKLWEWFIAPVFHVSNITMPLGLGLGLIAAHLTHQSNATPKDAELWDHLNRIFETLVIRPGILLLVGWLVKTWFVVGVVR